MVRVCCVKSCKEFWTPKTHLSFFAFPFKNEEMKEKWLNAAPGYKALSKHSSICSNHFLPEDYTTCSGKRMLKKTAVPSVFGPRCPNGCVNIPHTLIIDDEGCNLSGEMDPQMINLLRLGVQFAGTPQISSSNLHGFQRDEVPTKRFSSVSVQTCPRLSGPSKREKELQHKIKILQDRLRRREKMITNVKDLVADLKKSAGKSSDNLEDKFLRKFTKFDLELFKNEANNNNVAKNSKTYTKEMKKFASTLYSYSPRAYKFVRAKINLPHTATLRRWIGESASSTKETEINNEEVESNEIEAEESTETEEEESTEIENLESIGMEEVESIEMEEVESVGNEEVEYNEMEEAECIEIQETKYSDVKETIVTNTFLELATLPASVSRTDPCHGMLEKPLIKTTPISSTKDSNSSTGQHSSTDLPVK